MLSIICSTFGLVAAVADLLSHVWGSPLLLVVHGAVAAPDVAYTVEFTHRQAEIRRWRSLAVCLPALIAFLLFRLLFFK